jgi:hypothetical protein
MVSVAVAKAMHEKPERDCPRTKTWWPYSLTIEKVTVSMSARNSHAEA